MKPITIAGGGVAGLSLGIALRHHNIPVSLHEKKKYPFHRVCGEFISGVSNETLELLKISQLFKKAIPVQTVSWHIEDREIFTSSLGINALGISRYLLDKLLADEFISLGGKLHNPSSAPIKPTDGFINATGKGANQGGDWIGLSIHLKHTDITQLEMHSGPFGYIGLCPVENGLTNVTGLFKKSREVKGKNMELIINYLRKNNLHNLCKKFSSWTPAPDSFCAISGFQFGSRIATPSFSIGDSAKLIPPFVGNGMSMALESAAATLPILTSYSAGLQSWEDSQTQSKNACCQLFNKRMLVAQRLHPLLFSKLGLKSIALSSKLRILPVKTLFHLTR